MKYHKDIAGPPESKLFPCVNGHRVSASGSKMRANRAGLVLLQKEGSK